MKDWKVHYFFEHKDTHCCCSHYSMKSSDEWSKEAHLSKTSESHINLVNAEPQKGRLKTLVWKGWIERCPGESFLSSFAECSILVLLTSGNSRHFSSNQKKRNFPKSSSDFIFLKGYWWWQGSSKKLTPLALLACTGCPSLHLLPRGGSLQHLLVYGTYQPALLSMTGLF